MNKYSKVEKSRYKYVVVRTRYTALISKLIFVLDNVYGTDFNLPIDVYNGCIFNEDIIFEEIKNLIVILKEIVTFKDEIVCFKCNRNLKYIQVLCQIVQ